jgi:hypothetical protein
LYVCTEISSSVVDLTGAAGAGSAGNAGNAGSAGKAGKEGKEDKEDKGGAAPKKRKLDPREVWLVIHEYEPQIGGAGDFNRNMEHNPETFDITIAGVCSTGDKANLAALEYYRDIDGKDEDDDDDDSIKKKVGEGRFKDGGGSGSSHTYSQRVPVVKKMVQENGRAVGRR